MWNSLSVCLHTIENDDHAQPRVGLKRNAAISADQAFCDETKEHSVSRRRSTGAFHFAYHSAPQVM